MWREVRRLLPGESIVYFGDGKNCPYGTKLEQTIRRLTIDAIGRLMDRGAKIIMLGCNTATAAAIGDLRRMYPGFPFVGVEPALKPAVEQSRNKSVAVIATIAYMASDGYRQLVERYGNGVQVFSAPGKGFAMLVEENKEGTKEAFDTISMVIEPLIGQGADTLVLGCTHYPFLTRDIKRVIGDRPVTIINPAPAVARRVQVLLQQADALAPADNTPQFEFLSLAGKDYSRRLAEMARKALSMDI